MNDLEKKLKSYYKESFQHENKCERAKALAEIEPKKTPFYKRKAFLFPSIGTLVAAGCAGLIVGVSLNANKVGSAADYTVNNRIVKLELNPSVSISTDGDGKVSGVYGNNDDGKTFVIGQSYIGLPFQDALMQIVQDEIKTGYLVRGKKQLDCNKFAVTIYGESKDETLEKEISSHLLGVLKENDVPMGEGDISATSETNTDDLVDEDYVSTEGNNYEEVKEAIDSYYQSAEDYASEAVEEFYNLCYYYQDKISYFKTVLDQLTSSWDGYLFYEAKINSLESSFMTYANVYESKFLNEASGYMSLYKNIADERLNAFTSRLEYAQNEDWSEEMEEAMKAKEEALSTAITALNTFRNGILATYQSYLDMAVADLNSFTQMLSNYAEARAVIASDSFSKAYASLYASYLNSFHNHYKEEKENWITFVQTQKNRLIEGMKEILG